MKLGREETATFGCSIIKQLVSGLPQKFTFFKRLMQPEMYLLDQFERYRDEKKELERIVSLYFHNL